MHPGKHMHASDTHLQTSHPRQGGNCWFPASVNSKNLLSASNTRRRGRKQYLYVYICIRRILGVVSSNCLRPFDFAVLNDTAHVLKPNSPPAVQSQRVLNLVSNHNLWTALRRSTNTRSEKTQGAVLMIGVRAGDCAVTVEFKVCMRRAKITNDFSACHPPLCMRCYLTTQMLTLFFYRYSFYGADVAERITRLHDLLLWKRDLIS